MKRRDLLRRLLLGIGGVWVHATGARRAIAATEREALRADACWVTPEGDEGPFYLDSPFRSDIREGKEGVPFSLLITVIDSNCNPVPGVLVDVWHCDKGGVYSGVRIGPHPIIGQAFLRGTQTTDADGNVQFTSIYPGWYTNRATHVHFKVRNADTPYKTSQFAFPDAVNDAVYATDLYSRRGVNPMTNATDPEFSSAIPLYRMVDLTGDTTNGFQGTFTIGLDATTGTRRPTWGALKTLYR